MVRVAFAFHRRAGISQGKNLGVRFSGLWMVAPSTILPFLDEDAADLGLGAVVSAVTVWAKSKACRMKSRSSTVARHLSGALRPMGRARAQRRGGWNRMPARAFVFCCCDDDAKLSQPIVRSAWLSKIRQAAVG